MYKYLRNLNNCVSTCVCVSVCLSYCLSVYKYLHPVSPAETLTWLGRDKIEVMLLWTFCSRKYTHISVCQWVFLIGKLFQLFFCWSKHAAEFPLCESEKLETDLTDNQERQLAAPKDSHSGAATSWHHDVADHILLSICVTPHRLHCFPL